MKVLLLIDSMGIGGAETHVLTLAGALIKKQITVDVMCAGGVYAEALQRMGAAVIYAPFDKRSLRSVIQGICALRRCRSNGYRVIHAHTRFTAALANFALPRIPLVTTVHLDFSLSAAKRALSCWGRKALAVSPDLKEYLTREYGVRAENVILTKNAIDPSLFRVLKVRGKSILHVSRLDKDRSLTALLLCEAAISLDRRYPNIQIRIYGDGDDLAAVQAAAERANRKTKRETVLLCGSTCNVAEVLSAGSIFVGVSRAVLEAACSGLPVILSGNDGYGGIMTEETYELRRWDNFCCRSMAAPTAERLITDICYLLNHACFCENIRHKLAARIRADFTPDSMAQDALLAYYSALRVGIIGYYGFGNFGDEMMLEAIEAELRRRGIQEILPLKKGIGKGALSRRHPFRTVCALRRCDAVLFGGGNLLQNETSSRSFIYYALLLFLCRKGTPIGVGMGLGALKGKVARAVCGKVLSRFSALYLRTAKDAACAHALAPSMGERIRTACDPCLYFTPQPGKPQRSKTIIAIPRHNGSSRFLRFLSSKKKEGYRILPLCLFPEQDMQGAKRIATIADEKIQTVQDAKAFFSAASDARLCACERLHGAVFSLLSHTPCLLFSDSKKCIAFAEDVALAAERCHTRSPILCVRKRDNTPKKEREAEGFPFGFSEIISFLRDR